LIDMMHPRVAPTWDIASLRSHLQKVIDLELWTIPYYMAAMYSIKDPTTREYRTLLGVVHQEMLHVQLAANIANSFDLRPAFAAPEYGTTVPHVNFSIDEPNPISTYTPFSAAIGPLDGTRINTMCLIEYPDWNTQRQPDLRPNQDKYGSIAEFYAAVREGMRQHLDAIRGGVNQVDEFRAYYDQLPTQTVTLGGAGGYLQAVSLISVITDQGEGESRGDTPVAPAHRNTADGFDETWSHFKKFSRIRADGTLPDVYQGAPDPPAGSAGAVAQARLVRHFGLFLDSLESLFGGGDTSGFGPRMAQIGGDILTCWQRGAVPRFA
jgi:Ferritin-like